jgi:virginiamycin A acetyltransferase
MTEIPVEPTVGTKPARLLKGAANFIARICVLPTVLLLKIDSAWRKGDGLFGTFSQLLSLLPGTTGMYLRRAFYRATLEDCGGDVAIGFGTIFSHAAVRLGRGVYIGGGGTLGMVDIGDGTVIGSNVDIPSGRRQHLRGPDLQVEDPHEGAFVTISIGRKCWIGNSAVILAPIGNNCTVGAGSVVVKPVPDGQTVVGNPAREVLRNPSTPTAGV